MVPKKPRPIGARKLASAAPNATPTRHGYFQSYDGTRLFFSVEGQGKPLVFCYGLVCSSLHWTYQIEHFRGSHQAVWFDYRGHQNSETPKNLDSLTVDVMARDLLALLDELKLERPVLLGHSMGVNVVLEFAHCFPERVGGLVLANGTAKRPLETIFGDITGVNWAQFAFPALKKVHSLSPALFRRLWALQGHNPVTRAAIQLAGFNPHLTPPEDVAHYVDEVAEMDPAVFLKLIENYENYDATAWLHTLKVPTLIVAGEKDHVTPLREQELMHQLIPGSRLEVIPHGSHCPQMDLPELVNRKIAEFLAAMKY